MECFELSRHSHTHIKSVKAIPIIMFVPRLEMISFPDRPTCSIHVSISITTTGSALMKLAGRDNDGVRNASQILCIGQSFIHSVRFLHIFA